LLREQDGNYLILIVLAIIEDRLSKRFLLKLPDALFMEERIVQILSYTNKLLTSKMIKQKRKVFANKKPTNVSLYN